MSEAGAEGKRYLDGMTAVVTGSSRGIGRAVALGLVAEGARVVVNGRPDDAGRSEAADTLVREIEQRGGAAVAVAGSIAEERTSGRLVEACLDSFGQVDVLVCCAGVPEREPASILEADSAAWRDLIDTHLSGTFYACRHAAPHMARRGRGSIITTSSHASLGIYGGTSYAAAKGGVESLTLALAAELREKGIRANVVCPGAKTRLSSGPEFERRIESLHARGILQDATKAAALNPPAPECVAALYAFLASDESAAVSGRIFSAAGGYVGLFDERRESLLVYRDESKEPAWDVASLAPILLKSLLLKLSSLKSKKS